MKKSTDKKQVPARPATFQLESHHKRTESLRDEIAGGRIWHKCGCQSECSPLKEVLLSWPGVELEFDCHPEEMLMLARPDLSEIRHQTEKLINFYTQQGIKVHIYKPTEPPPPNFLFQRDLFWATPEGVILARPATRQRAGEERFAAEALAQIGVPVIMQFRGRATFEGADALWLDRKTVLLGTGVRTNLEAAHQLRRLLNDIGVELLEIPLPPNTQHLLGLINFVGPKRVVAHGGRISTELLELLDVKGINTIILPDSDELNMARGMNFVTLAPSKIVMPNGAPKIKAILEAQGIETHEIGVSEYLKGSGGIACLTGIIKRE